MGETHKRRTPYFGCVHTIPLFSFFHDPVHRLAASRSSAWQQSARCSSLVSSSLVCERPRRLCTNSMIVGTPARATSAASCSGPLGRRCTTPHVFADRRVAQLDQVGVEQDRLDLPDAIPLDARSSLRRRSARWPLWPRLQHQRQRIGVQVALVERHVALADDRGDDARLGDDAADGADAAVALARSRGSPARAWPPPPSASRRWSIGVEPACADWPVKRDRVALDAEGAEHDAQRQVHAFQHRPLLDVQLQIGGGVFQLLRRASLA